MAHTQALTHTHILYFYTEINTDTVKVIHFGTNRFLIYDFLYYRLSIVTFALGRTV